MPPCPSAAFLNMSKAPHSRASPSRCYRFRTRAGCWPASPGVFWNAPICLSAGRDCASPGQGSRALRPVERPHGGLRPWSACRRQPSDFPGWACSECPARATATTTSTATTTFHWPAGGAASPWAAAFRQAPRGVAALAAGLRSQGCPLRPDGTAARKTRGGQP